MITVKALDTYEKKNIMDMRLGRIPKKGEEFSVDEERFEVLCGKNEYGLAFVEVVEKKKNEKPKAKKGAKKDENKKMAKSGVGARS